MLGKYWKAGEKGDDRGWDGWVATSKFAPGANPEMVKDRKLMAEKVGMAGSRGIWPATEQQQLFIYQKKGKHRIVMAKESLHAGDLGLDSWVLEDSWGGGDGYPFQILAWESHGQSHRLQSMGHKESETTEQLKLSFHFCLMAYVKIKKVHTTAQQKGQRSQALSKMAGTAAPAQSNTLKSLWLL